MRKHELYTWLDTDAFVESVKGCAYKDIEAQRKRYKHVFDAFVEKFHISSEDEIHVFSTSGRCEIGGNHTDHQYGRVLAAAIDKDLIAFVKTSSLPVVSVYSTGFGMIECKLDDLRVSSDEYYTSSALIRGIAHKMSEKATISGLDIMMDSQVATGSGMSSSAAFEVLMGTIFNHVLADQPFTAVEIAQIGQFAENVYFNKPCGLMDQMAASVGGFVSIDFYDPAVPVVEKIDVSFDESHLKLVLIDTKGSHARLSDEYGYMPKEMKEVAALLGEQVLSRVTLDQFLKHCASLRHKVSDRALLRSYHFLKETERAKLQAQALNQRNFQQFLDLVNESGRSSFMYLQNVITSGAVDEQPLALALALVEAILKTEGAYRVHGGGLAGSILAFVPQVKVNQIQEVMEGVFGADAVVILNLRSIGSTKII